MASSEPQPVYLIDASIYIFQSHFSPYVEFTDEEGEDLSALAGFTQFLLQFLRRHSPTHIAIAHDESLFCGFRHRLCDNYKSNRELPDENLARQLAGCLELGKHLGIAAFASKEFEADDIIGALATRSRLGGDCETVAIVSRDKDLAQLLSADEDCLWDYNANRRRFRRDIIKELGITPEQIPDYLGLIGDSVDCIAGVPGVGPVKAKALLQEFGSMDRLYENLHLVPKLELRGAARLADSLDEHRELAFLSRQLATIICEMADENEHYAHLEFDDLRQQAVQTDAFADFLARYRFAEPERKRLLSVVRSLDGRA